MLGSIKLKPLYDTVVALRTVRVFCLDASCTPGMLQQHNIRMHDSEIITATYNLDRE